MPPRRNLCILMLVSLWTTLAAAQGNTCPAFVETAFSATDANCQGISRNQACYGNIAIDAEPRAGLDSLNFSQVGDIVDVSAIGTMRLSPMDIEAGVWGVALLRVQANLPDTLPGQNVTMIVFGDTQITNHGSAGRPIAATINTDADLHYAPDDGGILIGSLEAGQTIAVLGRSEDGDWLLARLEDDTTGWVESGAVDFPGRPNLHVVAPGEPVYGAMQAFTLRTGVGQPACAEVPANGILVQTPPGAAPVTLAINDVEIQFGSTLFFRAAPGDMMIVSVIEGAARVEANGEARPALQGGRIRIPISDTLVPRGVPGVYEPYDEVLLQPLPVAHLERDVPIAPAVTQTQADLVNRYEAHFEQISVDDYDDLLTFLEAAPNATSEEVTAFTATLNDE